MRMKAAARQRTTLSLNPALYKKVKRIAAQDRRDVSTILEIALESYIKLWKQKNTQLPAAQQAEG